MYTTIVTTSALYIAADKQALWELIMLYHID